MGSDGAVLGRLWNPHGTGSQLLAGLGFLVQHT